MTEPLTVRCPQCGKTVRWAPESKWRPFCSARCKQLDLGAWASESYHVPGAMPPDSDEPDNRSGND